MYNFGRGHNEENLRNYLKFGPMVLEKMFQVLLFFSNFSSGGHFVEPVQFYKRAYGEICEINVNLEQWFVRCL